MSNAEKDVDSKIALEEEREFDGEDFHKCSVPPMRINCDLEVSVGSENKMIYVCPGKVQYFKASAISCSGDKGLEIEYCGSNVKFICGEAVICGCLGYYKIVRSGILFIPRHKLSKFNNDLFPTDILCFKVKDKDLKFEVIFTYSKYGDCDCNKRCKFVR